MLPLRAPQLVVVRLVRAHLAPALVLVSVQVLEQEHSVLALELALAVSLRWLPHLLEHLAAVPLVELVLLAGLLGWRRG